MKKIAILGSTGSIGTQTLEIVRTNGRSGGLQHLQQGIILISWRNRSENLSRNWQQFGKKKEQMN